MERVSQVKLVRLAWLDPLDLKVCQDRVETVSQAPPVGQVSRELAAKGVQQDQVPPMESTVQLVLLVSQEI